MSLRVIPVVFRRGPEIALFKWSKCSILQLCNNYCPLIVPSSPKYSCNEKELLPACVRLHFKNKHYFFQAGASSQRAKITQQYMSVTFGRHFIRKDQWPSSSPDCNPLNHHFQDSATKRYERVQLGTFLEPCWVEKTNSKSLGKCLWHCSIKEGNFEISFQIAYSYH